MQRLPKEGIHWLNQENLLCQTEEGQMSLSHLDCGQMGKGDSPLRVANPMPSSWEYRRCIHMSWGPHKIPSKFKVLLCEDTLRDLVDQIQISLEIYSLSPGILELIQLKFRGTQSQIQKALASWGHRLPWVWFMWNENLLNYSNHILEFFDADKILFNIFKEIKVNVKGNDEGTKNAI